MEQPADNRHRKMAALEFKPLLENVHKGDLLLLDVRSPEEYRNGNMVGAINVPVDQIRNGLEGLDRETTLLVYCKVGKRCIRTVDELKQMNFNDTMVLDGSIGSWKSHLAQDII